jgi:hypothetical protein
VEAISPVTTRIFWLTRSRTLIPIDTKYYIWDCLTHETLGEFDMSGKLPSHANIIYMSQQMAYIQTIPNGLLVNRITGHPIKRDFEVPISPYYLLSPNESQKRFLRDTLLDNIAISSDMGNIVMNYVG